MASDPARQFIEDVNVELDAINSQTNLFTVGKLKQDEHSRPPIINWQLGSITHGPAEVVNSIGTEVQELVVRIWADGVNPDDKDWNARDLKNKLLRACRIVAFRTALEEPIEFGDFEWNEEAHKKLGRSLLGSVFVKLNIVAEVYQTVTVAQTQVTEHADYDGDGTNDETIHTTPFFP